VTAAGPPIGGQPAPVVTPEPVVLPPIYSNPYAVQVQGFEFGLQLSKATVSAGDVRVEFNLSRAEDPHNLWLLREDGTGTPYSFDEEPSGAVVARTLALTRGRWKLFCSLPGHEAAGMRAVLTVGG
jgi:plastocyanin